MQERKPVICVYSNEGGGAPFWMSRSERNRLVHLTELVEIERLFDPSCAESREECAAIVLDRSVTARRYLELLARLPLEFRGDVLRIEKNGSGVLSTCAIREGRLLYRLDAEDVVFYLDARFELSESFAFSSEARPALLMTA